MKSRKVHIIIGICLSTIILLTGCSFNNSSSSSKTTASSNVSESSKAKSIDVKALTTLIQKIQSEKGVSGVNTTGAANVVTVDITLNKDDDSRNAKRLADKYSKQIKEAYISKKININIIQNGKKITTLSVV